MTDHRLLRLDFFGPGKMCCWSCSLVKGSGLFSTDNGKTVKRNNISTSSTEALGFCVPQFEALFSPELDTERPKPTRKKEVTMEPKRAIGPKLRPLRLRGWASRQVQACLNDTHGLLSHFLLIVLRGAGSHDHWTSLEKYEHLAQENVANVFAGSCNIVKGFMNYPLRS